MVRSSSSKAAKRAGGALLVSSAIGAVNTVNARKPLSRKGPVSVLSFFPGWFTSEMPLHAIGWQVLATLGFARRGALRSKAGLVGLGISAASWATLYRIWQAGTDAGSIYQNALTEGLGDDLADDLTDHSGTHEVKLASRRIAQPVSAWRQTYAQHKNLSYGDDSRRNRLDIWKKPGLADDGSAPVLLQVHGGAWIVGNKEQQAMPLLAHMAESGWIGVSINYRLSPLATWPDHIVDVKRALAWVKANIADYGGDPDYVAITGGSAGGHLSSLAALSANEPVFQPGFEEADTSVVAAVPFYGVYDWVNRDGTGRSDMEDILGRLVLKSKLSEARETWEQASTMTWVGPDAPPFMVIHGENDSLVPVEQARSFVQMLRNESKNPVVYAELPGTQHAFEVFDSPRTIYTGDAVHRFLESIRIRDGHGVGRTDQDTLFD